MTGPRDRFRDPSPTIKTKSKMDEDLDRSRKKKLWKRSNLMASIVIVFIVAMAYLNMCADVRGEFAGTSNLTDRMVMCSVAHSGGELTLSMIIPGSPMMVAKTTDEKIANELTLVFTPVHPRKGVNNIIFKGKIDSSTISGLLQDGLQIYPLTLQKDPVASVLQQLKAFIPGANTPIDLSEPRSMQR